MFRTEGTARSVRTPMNPALTADDLWPIVKKLSREERLRLANLVLQTSRSGGPEDRARYRNQPPSSGEFGSDEDPLAWESDGWEDDDAPR